MEAAILRNYLEVCLEGFQMKYWPRRGRNFTSRIHFTQTPSDLWHPPFGWSDKKGQELNRQRDNTVLSFPQSWSVCSEILVILHKQSGQFCACMIVKSHEPWLKPITQKGKTFLNKKSLLTVNTKQNISPQLVDCQRNHPLYTNEDNEVTITCPSLKWSMSLQSAYGLW